MVYNSLEICHRENRQHSLMKNKLYKLYNSLEIIYKLYNKYIARLLCIHEYFYNTFLQLGCLPHVGISTPQPSACHS